MAVEARQLTRALGSLEVTAGGVGIIIGAGIYVLLGEAANTAGGAVWLSFLLAAALCAFTGLSYAELASMFPSAAAEFTFTRKAFPEWTAFLVGWVMIAALIVAAAAVSLGFGRYLGQFSGEVDDRIPAVGLLACLLVLGASGIARAARVILLLSLVQVGGLLVVIVLGAPHLGEHSLTAGSSPGGIVTAAALVFFAFIGFDEVITLAEETRDPSRTVPRALLAALGISTLLYVATAVVGVSVLGASALAASKTPLADVVDSAAGGGGADLVAAAALVSTTNTALLALTAASRLLYGMGTAEALPRFFAGITNENRVPLVSLAIATSLAAAVALSGRLAAIAGVTDFSVYLVFIAVNLTVIALRFRQPEAPRSFRTPFSVRRLPLLPVFGLATTALLMPALEPNVLVAGAVLCAAGLGFGLFLDPRSALRRRGKN